MISNATNHTRNALSIALSAVVLLVLGHSVSAQSSLDSSAVVGVTNRGGFVAGLDSHSVPDSGNVSATADHFFTGLDGAGVTQTMEFSGTTVAQSDYGRLHCYTTGTVLNSYYNQNNPDFSNHNGQIVDPNGSPASLVSLGFATFTDTLQYGGQLQNGYRVRYIFHVSGTNTGTGALADLAFTIDNLPGEAFFAGDVRHYSEDWVTQDYIVDGVSAQHVHVQFSDQVVFDTFSLAQGQDYTGTSDFSATLELTAIEMVDANGNPVIDGWTVTSASGTEYPHYTPEPATLTLLALGALVLRRGSKPTR